MQQKSLKFSKYSWTFEFLSEPFKILREYTAGKLQNLREYNCFRVLEKAREIQIQIQNSVIISISHKRKALTFNSINPTPKKQTNKTYSAFPSLH
jgi:hypothetical protein